MADGRIPCRCLLDEQWPELHQAVRDYIDLLPEEQKASDDVYQARLAACKACDHLRDGTCGLCGCYVEARAAKRSLGCPALPAKWEKMKS